VLLLDSFSSIVHLADARSIAVKHEVSYVIGTLEYTKTRLSTSRVMEKNWRSRHLEAESMSIGSFLNLHCGHNNPFSESERKRLKALLKQATSDSSNRQSSTVSSMHII
jgi:hypothetical protein